MSDIWSWVNHVDDALISSITGSAGDLTVSNLKDSRTGKIWRAGGMPAELRMAFSTNVDASIFGIFGVNFAEIGIVTLRLGTTPGSGNLWQQVIDPDDITLDSQAVYLIRDGDGALAPVSAAHATVLAQGGVPLEVGRVWVGHADWQAQVAHTVNGSSWRKLDLSARSVTPRSGAYLIDKGARRKSFTANYDALYPDEYGGPLLEMDDLSLQMLMVPAPDVYDPHDFGVLGYLEDTPETQFLGYLRAGRSMTIRESG